MEVLKLKEFNPNKLKGIESYLDDESEMESELDNE